MLVSVSESVSVSISVSEVSARDHLHLPLYLTHLLTYLYKQASSVSSIRVSVRGLC